MKTLFHCDFCNPPTAHAPVHSLRACSTQNCNLFTRKLLRSIKINVNNRIKYKDCIY